VSWIRKTGQVYFVRDWWELSLAVCYWQGHLMLRPEGGEKMQERERGRRSERWLTRENRWRTSRHYTPMTSMGYRRQRRLCKRNTLRYAHALLDDILESPGQLVMSIACPPLGSYEGGRQANTEKITEPEGTQALRMRSVCK